MTLAAVLLTLLVAASPAELRDRAIAGDHVGYEFVTQLTTLFGPRPAGSPSEQKAAHWAADRLRALGFENVHLETFPMTGWVRGDERVEILAPNPQPVVATALGGSPAAAGVEGEIVAFESMDELIAAPKGSLAGKIAFVDRRTTRMQNGQGYGVAGAGRARTGRSG